MRGKRRAPHSARYYFRRLETGRGFQPLELGRHLGRHPWGDVLPCAFLIDRHLLETSLAFEDLYPFWWGHAPLPRCPLFSFSFPFSPCGGCAGRHSNVKTKHHWRGDKQSGDSVPVPETHSRTAHKP